MRGSSVGPVLIDVPAKDGGADAEMGEVGR